MSVNDLFMHLVSLGDHFPLKVRACPGTVRLQLKEFEHDWKEYNPNKPGYGRMGLSVTSLDGKLGGQEDLTSLSEHLTDDSPRFNELSFRTPTPVWEKCTAIHEIMNPFAEFLGRTHFLKFERGGFFPFHRDSFKPGDNSFRIFVPLNLSSPRDFVFLLGDRRLSLEPGRAYFINTRMEHAVFSFAPESVHLVINVELHQSSVDRLCELLMSY